MTFEQVSVLSFPGKSVTNPSTLEEWETWFALAENPHQEPRIGCTRQPALPPTTLPRALLNTSLKTIEANHKS